MKYLLISFNIACAVIHLLFGVYIYDKPFEYAGFISIENTLIIFVYLLLSLLLYSQRGKEGTLLNLLFWSTFEICVLFFRPLKTTLDVFEIHLPVAQWEVLAEIGGMVVLLNCVVYLKGICNKANHVI